MISVALRTGKIFKPIKMWSLIKYNDAKHVHPHCCREQNDESSLLIEHHAGLRLSRDSNKLCASINTPIHRQTISSQVFFMIEVMRSEGIKVDHSKALKCH